jgi:hypothetical protein
MPGVEDAAGWAVEFPATDPPNAPANPRGPMAWLMLEVALVANVALLPIAEPMIDLPRE